MALRARKVTGLSRNGSQETGQCLRLIQVCISQATARRETRDYELQRHKK